MHFHFLPLGLAESKAHLENDKAGIDELSTVHLGTDLADINRALKYQIEIDMITLPLYHSYASIFGLSFALPAVVLPAIRLYTPTVKKMWFVSMIGIIIATFVYITPGLTGYFIFGEETNPYYSK